ncbi:MAG TPA: (2Fe-2S)-binding protein [Acidobacteriaceae bacterium]|nr:(2Fe-2S)-binding protein [Acidobacteriaceae bacterium]
MPDAAEALTLTLNGEALRVAPGTTVAAALLLAASHARISVTGEPRAPLCGMGICYECRVTINGIPHQKSCQILCQPGMDVRTP